MIQEENNQVKVSIRKFKKEDIQNKIRWINNKVVNKYLHYELPLEIKKTENWFLENKDRKDRFDGVILVNEKPVGLIGLLSIDRKQRESEYYIAIGEPEWFGKKIAKKASSIILEYGFYNLALTRIYLYVDNKNIKAINLYEKIGFVRNGSIKNGKNIKLIYEIKREKFQENIPTPITNLKLDSENDIYIKREDLIPFSFGGNKARKAKYFFREIDSGGFGCVVTYGSSSSNHCRVIANMASERKIPCYIILAKENSKTTSNLKMMKMFGAHIEKVSVSDVHVTIEKLINSLKQNGQKPYFIPGGGHGNLGTQAYVDCYWEIKNYEIENNIFFDYIFLASGTGTTQSGLVCGQLLAKDKRKIIGISIARKNPIGRQIVLDSIREYLCEKKIDFTERQIEEATFFCDKYIGNGYAQTSENIIRTAKDMLIHYGIPMDCTYTGKAYAGMQEYLDSTKEKKILFIHTGGMPLFFDNFII